MFHLRLIVSPKRRALRRTCCAKVRCSAALGALAVVLLLAGGGKCQDGAGDASTPPDLAAAAEEFAEAARRTASSYELTLARAPDRKLTLEEGSLLRWTNPLGGRQANGHVFLWTDRGRPEATASIYQFVGDADGKVHEHHEFSSLSPDPLMATGPRVWAPEEAGIQLSPVPEAIPPASSRASRLRQMRGMAGKFTADKTTRDGIQRTLRLLPQPVYRYEGDHPDVLDGALFAFVEATDPELFLWLEADAAASPRWRYGIARMNSIQLRASYDGVMAWEAPTLRWRDALNRRDLPYTAFQIR